MCPSSEPVSSFSESGENVSDRMGMAWPSSVFTTLPEGISKMFTMPSIAPDAMYFPSGD